MSGLVKMMLQHCCCRCACFQVQPGEITLTCQSCSSYTVTLTTTNTVCRWQPPLSLFLLVFLFNFETSPRSQISASSFKIVWKLSCNRWQFPDSIALLRNLKTFFLFYPFSDSSFKNVLEYEVYQRADQCVQALLTSFSLPLQKSRPF